MDMLTQGIFTAAMILWLLSYFGWRRVFAFAGVLDIAITLTMMYMFSGSYAGMMTGVFAGVIVSMVLKFGGRVFGTERPRVIRKAGALTPSIIWTRSRT